MPIQDISEALSGVSGPGAQLTPKCYLQLYLAYARAVSDGDDETVRSILERTRLVSGPPPTGSPESFFEEDVYNALAKLGYRVDCQVGDSGFRIDLAVAAPVPRSGYMLGIECDGATYHSDLSARLRDVWREGILRSRGWRFHRIWSTRWWHQRNEEIEKLKFAVADAAERFFEVDEFWKQIEPAEVTLALWRKRKEMLLARYEGATDPQAKERVRGQIAVWHAWGTDHAHRVCIQDALAGGRLVPAEVLADYPDLAGQCGRC
jgi:very-short-patch-repair endonuclease